jgi:hypothetical protein
MRYAVLLLVLGGCHFTVQGVGNPPAPAGPDPAQAGMPAGTDPGTTSAGGGAGSPDLGTAPPDDLAGAPVCTSDGCHDIDRCSPSCAAGCCTLSCTKAKSCAFTCAAGSSCEATANDSDDASLTCAAGASCLLDCTKVPGTCQLDCPTGALDCGGGVHVCNRSCP